MTTPLDPTSQFDPTSIDLSKEGLPPVEQEDPIAQDQQATLHHVHAARASSFAQLDLTSLNLGDCGHEILIQPGWQNSGATHWQSQWQDTFLLERIEHLDWNTPVCKEWMLTIANNLAGKKSPIIVAHSLGCIAVVQAISQGIIKPTAVILVAPADMDRNVHNVTATGFSPIPTTPLGCPALVIASTDHKYMTSDRSRVLAMMWGADFKLLPGHGHINAASNLGEWVDGQRLVFRFLLEKGLLS